LPTIYPPTRATDFAQFSTVKFNARILVRPHQSSGPVLNAEFCHAREKDQQLNPGTTALPKLRAAHAPGSKDATV
jgi:hypothetical protein